jgi:hypothetical protein
MLRIERTPDFHPNAFNVLAMVAPHREFAHDGEKADFLQAFVLVPNQLALNHLLYLHNRRVV